MIKRRNKYSIGLAIMACLAVGCDIILPSFVEDYSYEEVEEENNYLIEEDNDDKRLLP